MNYILTKYYLVVLLINVGKRVILSDLFLTCCLEVVEKIFSEDSIQAIGTTGYAKMFCLTPFNSL